MTSDRAVRRAACTLGAAGSLALIQCTGGESRSTDIASDTLAAVDSVRPAADTGELLTPALRDGGRDSFRRVLGNPDSISSEVIPNRHMPGVRDTLYTLHYPTLTATVHRPGGGRDLLSRVLVRDNRHLRVPAVGMTPQRLETTFGQPTERRDSAIVYRCIGCGEVEEPVEFVLRDGRVVRVRLSFYVD